MRALSLFASVTLGSIVFACGGDVDPVQFEDPDAGRVRRDSGAADVVVTPVIDSGVVDSGVVKDSGTPDSSTCADPTDLGGLESPRALPAITDSDANPPHSVQGILSSATDKDSYSFFGEDKVGALVGLTAKIDIPNAELCIFMKCKNGTPTNVSACSKGTKATDPVAGPGCCGTTEVTPDYDCGGTFDNDSAEIEIHVKATAPMCQAYRVDYNM
jgi:hypothetical protein